MNKKTLLTLLQIAITAGILAFLFRDGDKNHKVLAALSQANPRWIVAAFVGFLVILVSGVTRWKLLLRVQGIVISWWRIAALFMIGVFFNPFLPGAVGGDVAKVFYLLKETPGKRPAALLAVLMDRIMGLLGLILIAGVVIVLRYHWLTQNAATAGLLYTLLAIFAGSGGFIVISFAITGLGLVDKLPQWMPLRAKLVEMSVAYNQYGKAWGTSLVALALCLPIHLTSFTLVYCVAQAFPESAGRGSLLDYWGFMPIVNTIISVPISIGGMGVREGLIVQLLGNLCQVPEATALSISLTGAFVLLLWSLVGGVVYLFYRPSEHAKLGEMNQVVSQLEEEIEATAEKEQGSHV